MKRTSRATRHRTPKGAIGSPRAIDILTSMSRFNVDSWRSRAWSRYQRAQSRDRGKASDRFVRDILAIPAIEAIDAWCSRQGLTVNFSRSPNALYHGDEARIDVNANLAPETQMHLMLHECGHHLIKLDAERNPSSYAVRYSCVDHTQSKRGFGSRCDVVDEEFEAWHRGWLLAEQLGLQLDRCRFDNTKKSSLKTYVKWSLSNSTRDFL